MMLYGHSVIFLFVIYAIFLPSKYNVASVTIEVQSSSICEHSPVFNAALNGSDRLKSFTCRGVTSLPEMLTNLPADVEDLVIEDSFISDSVLKETNSSVAYKFLRSVIVQRSYMGSALRWLQSLENLESLSLIYSSTTYVINHSDMNVAAVALKLSSFPRLKMLKISRSNITSIDISQVTSVPDLILPDNLFECGSDFIWLLNHFEKQKTRVDLNNAKCFMKKIDENVSHPIIYSLRGKPLLPVLRYKRESVDSCPPKCICELKGMLTVERPQLNVDCIGLNMTKLPNIIPNGSSRCNFSYNFIQDLTPLYSNRLYDKVAMMALSHNYISYLDPVLFPDLLRKRRDVGFWLDYNRLNRFPAETVKRVYDEAHKDRYMPQFFLGHNPYLCTCEYIGYFQDLIYQQMFNIFDARDIKCSESDPFNPGMMVLTLDVGNLCSTEPMLKSLDLLNLILAIILLILIIDFAHNYYQYRKYRKLPWIVTKIKFKDRC